MELNWTHNTTTGELRCDITNNLYYIAIRGGEKIHKYINNELVNTIKENDDWEDEKHWLGQEHTNIVGSYTPLTWEESSAFMKANPFYIGAQPLFGVDGNQKYLDRLARSSAVQEGHDMERVLLDVGNGLYIEIDSGGNYWQRDYDPVVGDFYNVQPCCVFPDNPGRKAITKEKAERLIKKYS